MQIITSENGASVEIYGVCDYRLLQIITQDRTLKNILCLFRDQEALGSNPSTPTTQKALFFKRFGARGKRAFFIAKILFARFLPVALFFLGLYSEGHAGVSYLLLDCFALFVSALGCLDNKQVN